MCISMHISFTQTHKSKATALQLHDTHRSQRWTAAGTCWAPLNFWPRYEKQCIAAVPLSISAPRSSHGIQLGRRIFSALNRKVKSISVLPILPSRCWSDISLLLWGSQMRDGTQINMGISPRPPIISIPYPPSLSTMVKITLYYTWDGLSHPLLV